MTKMIIPALAVVLFTGTVVAQSNGGQDTQQAPATGQSGVSSKDQQKDLKRQEAANKQQAKADRAQRKALEEQDKAKAKADKVAQKQ
jgi:hypothetical protein